jgi:hypothetical protein
MIIDHEDLQGIPFRACGVPGDIDRWWEASLLQNARADNGCKPARKKGFLYFLHPARRHAP